MLGDEPSIHWCTGELRGITVAWLRCTAPPVRQVDGESNLHAVLDDAIARVDGGVWGRVSSCVVEHSAMRARRSAGLLAGSSAAARSGHGMSAPGRKDQFDAVSSRYTSQHVAGATVEWPVPMVKLLVTPVPSGDWCGMQLPLRPWTASDRDLRRARQRLSLHDALTQCERQQAPAVQAPMAWQRVRGT